MNLEQLKEVFPNTFGLLDTIINEEGKYVPIELLITSLVTLNEDTEYLNGKKQGKSDKPIPVSTVNNEDLLMEYMYMYVYTANRILKENKDSIKKSSEKLQMRASELQAEFAKAEPIIKTLKKEVEELQKQNTNLSKKIEELRGEIEELEHKNAILRESKETFQKDKERLDSKKINDEWDELSNEAKSIVSIWNAFINDCDVNNYFQPKTGEPTEQLHELRLLVDKDMEKLENLVNTQSKVYGDFLQRWEAKYK